MNAKAAKALRFVARHSQVGKTKGPNSHAVREYYRSLKARVRRGETKLVWLAKRDRQNYLRLLSMVRRDEERIRQFNQEPA